MFHTLLQSTGLNYHTDPVMQSLRRIGAARFMNRNFAQVSPNIKRETVQMLLVDTPEWIVISNTDTTLTLMPGVDLVRALNEQQDDEIDLQEIPATRYELAPLRMQATLQEALEKLEKSSAEALYIEWFDQQHYWRIQGILTRSQIESAYRF
ncbi:MAG: hypothetical protein KZQ65_09535 [Candidatus Thiodiazotropha sp. (ex Gloverina cf. vestifex)]|nr:hypothetical protein [Candidatus Thiodiazotropha sp. (ex Gloverina cf. vestifex)]